MALFFYDPSIFESNQKRYKELYNFDISEPFMKCAGSQLTQDFIRKTGRKLNKKVSFSVTIADIEYRKGEISSFMQNLWVDHNWIPVKISWKSKSGRIYTPDECELDCNDIEFWLENLDVPLILGILDKQIPLPFETGDLDFKLKVSSLNVHCLIILKFKDDHSCNESGLIEEIDKFIDSFNSRSENNNWENGAIHNWRGVLKSKKIEYEIDLGSATPVFFEQFLRFISKLSCFKSVDIM